MRTKPKKKMKQEDLMEEINMVVNCHIKNARASRPGIFSRAPSATVTQQQMSQQQQQQGQNLSPPHAKPPEYTTSAISIY